MDLKGCVQLTHLILNVKLDTGVLSPSSISPLNFIKMHVFDGGKRVSACSKVVRHHGLSCHPQMYTQRKGSVELKVKDGLLPSLLAELIATHLNTDILSLLTDKRKPGNAVLCSVQLNPHARSTLVYIRMLLQTARSQICKSDTLTKPAQI